MSAATTALLLVGAPGAGKTTMLEALGTELERRGLAYGSIESEQLAMGWPLLPGDVWIPLLASVLGAQRAAGRTRFLIAATPESAAELASVQAAIPADRIETICLSAPPDVVAARLATREPDTWPGKQALITHARHLATTIPTFPGITTTLAPTDRPTSDVARELAERLR